MLSSCARMGQPDGGWYDEEPPHVIGATPADKGTRVDTKRVIINFNEYIKLADASSNVIISPPQLEQADIRAAGKKIIVALQDSLKPNTTYTIDFSDAITDNNEGNPMGNYTYCFSTGEQIDTMEVSGYVLDAQNLEPVQGILVGLYDDLADSAFISKPMLRVARTDSRGHFVVKGIANGTYRAYALKDVDGDFRFTQRSEMMAYDPNTFVPSSKPDVRIDTIWRDTLHIDALKEIHYTHFLPDDIVLMAFNHTITDRYLLKTERHEPNRIDLFFTSGSDSLPTLRGLNFVSDSAFVVEATENRDTVYYWLRDTTLINRDTLEVELSYLATDTTGLLVAKTDTLEVLPKTSYERRQKDLAKELEKWAKEQEKKKKRGESYDSVMPPVYLIPKYNAPAGMDPDRNITIEMPVPLRRCDMAGIHLYSMIDSLWYITPFTFQPSPNTQHTTHNTQHPTPNTQHPQLSAEPDGMPAQAGTLTTRRYELLAEWRPEVEYSLEIDSAAFEDIYGHVNKAYKQGIKVNSLDTYSTLIVVLSGHDGASMIVELLNTQDAVVKRAPTDSEGTAEFYYVQPGKYYLRAFNDRNGNGQWDTGDYYNNETPEDVYYFAEEIECKAKWDVTRNWNIKAWPRYEQKPNAITKQKAGQKKKQQNRNAERAKKLGKEYLGSKGVNI